MLKLKLESGTRRIYGTESGALAVEVCTTDHTGIKGSAMDVYVKNGWVPRFMEKTLGAQTYFKLPDGTQVGELFNPTIKAGQADFDWLLEATPENEEAILREVFRRYSAWYELVSADFASGGETLGGVE